MSIYNQELKASDAYLLARVSTKEQKEDGNSLPAQERRIIEYIQRHQKLELVESFIFDESAHQQERKKFEGFLKRVTKSRKSIAICSDKVDRLIRDFITWLPKLDALRKEGIIELHFASDNLVIHQNSPATDLFRFHMAVILAQYYSDSISDNTKRSLEGKVMRGEWPTGTIPRGYKPVRKVVNNKMKTVDIILDESECYMIQELFKLYATGLYSLDQLRDYTFAKGFCSKNKNKLSRRVIAEILHNTFYFGLMRFKGQTFPHIYKTLISKELFTKVQAVFNEKRSNKTKSNQKVLKIFQGLIKCKRCGCSITPEYKKGGRYILYACTNYHRTCEKIYINETELIKQVEGIFKDIQLSDQQVVEITTELKNLHESHKFFQDKTIEKLQSDHRTVQGHIDSLFDKYTQPDSVISDDMYKTKLSQLKEKQRDISRELEMQTNQDEHYHVTAQKILSLAQRAHELFMSSEIEQKRQLLNFALQNLELDGKKLCYTMRSPFDEILKAKSCNEMGDYRELNPNCRYHKPE